MLKKPYFFVIKIQRLIIKVAVATTPTIMLLFVSLRGQLCLFIVMQFNFLDIY